MPLTYPLKATILSGNYCVNSNVFGPVVLDKKIPKDPLTPYWGYILPLAMILINLNLHYVCTFSFKSELF
jgi:hypothetical protein